MNVWIDSSEPNAIKYRATISSMGDVYVGGTAKNIVLQIRTSGNYPGEGQMVGQAVLADSYTIGREEQHEWQGSLTYLNTGVNTVWAFLFADGSVQSKTAVVTSS